MTKIWDKIKSIAVRSKGITMLGSGNIIATGISGIFWFYIASLVGVENYGEISYFVAMGALVGVIATLGAQNTITVFTAKGEKVIPQFAFISLISGLISSFVLFFIFYNIGVSLYVIGYVFFAIASAEILGRKLYKNYSKYIIIQRLLMVSLGVGFYFLMGPQGVIVGIALSFFVYSIRIYKECKGAKLDFSILKPKRNFIIHNYITDLTGILTSSLDKIIIVPLFGFIILGNYQLGIQFLTVLLLIPAIVYQYILPEDASGVANRKLKLLLVLVSVISSIFGIWLSPLVIPVFFPQFMEAIQVVQIVSLTLIPHSFVLILQSKFLAQLKSNIVFYGNGIFLITEVLAIIFLGELFGINGVASGIVLASILHAGFYLIMNKNTKKTVES